MSEVSDTVTDPLLNPVTDEQRYLLEIIGEAVVTAGGWPVYQYVQAKMDNCDLDLEVVLSSLPAITADQLVYSPVRRDRHGDDGTPIALTVAGLAHLDQFRTTVATFLGVVARLAEERAAAQFDPLKVVDVVVPFERLTRDFDEMAAPRVNLRELLGAEPATWLNQVFQGEGGAWFVRTGPSLRRFRGVATVEDYLARFRAWIAPGTPVQPPAPLSPLGLVAALDYLDVVFRLRFGSHLLTFASVERAARLVFEAGTAEEFDNRLSALGEMLKGFRVPGKENRKPLKELSEFLSEHLPAEAATRVDRALAVLQAVTHVRNGGQHVGAVEYAATALPSLGLTFPVVNHAAAWRMIQAHTVAALDTLREEIRANLAAAPGAQSVARLGGA
jgi:hypothetical protein